MTLTSFIVLLIVAGICGTIGRALVGYSHLGCLGSIALGFVGALLGLWIARALHLPEVFAWRVGNDAFPVFWSIVGSALVVSVLSWTTRRRAYYD